MRQSQQSPLIDYKQRSCMTHRVHVKRDKGSQVKIFEVESKVIYSGIYLLSRKQARKRYHLLIVLRTSYRILYIEKLWFTEVETYIILKSV